MFTNFKKAIQDHFAKLSETADHIYQVEMDKDELWNLYLNSFPDGTNEIYRERREYDCSCCRQFIRTIGNVVFIQDAIVHTIWELEGLGAKFQPVMDISTLGSITQNRSRQVRLSVGNPLAYLA